MLRSLVLGECMLVAEAVMLTRLYHQLPMAEMVTRAQSYVRAIERECCVRDGISLPTVPSGVRLKVMLCYVSLAGIVSRMGGDQSERVRAGSVVFDWKDFSTYHQFEFPDETTYEPLYLDTSEESPVADRRRVQEVIAFLNDELNLVEINGPRKMVAQVYFAEAYQKVDEAQRST